jgi:hypothetical protein
MGFGDHRHGSFIALIRYKVGVIPVILACGVVGLAYSLVRPPFGI